MRAITVRIPDDMHKEFSKKLIDDEVSAQEFFLNKVKEYLEQEP